MSFCAIVLSSVACLHLASGMWCLDGNECSTVDTCALCEGAACIKVQRPHPQRGISTAMTCLPHDSLIHAYHPEGCRTDLSTGEKLCLCSEKDFCNGAVSVQLLAGALLLIAFQRAH